MLKPTAQTILEAALDALREEGYAGASSRAIARRGGFNQALIFYYYGSREGLLLAALKHTSAERLARYREGVASATTLDELVRVMADLWAEDKARGHVQVVSQVVAGTVNKPELTREVVALMEPWIELAEETLARVLPEALPVREAAYAAVVFYLGVNLMTHLDPDHTRTDALFERARELAPLLAAFRP